MSVLDKLLNLLQVLYVIRFSLLSLLFLAGLRVIVFNFGVGRTLLAGLFDLPECRNTFWLAFFACTLSWTAITLLKISIILGGRRLYRGGKENYWFGFTFKNSKGANTKQKRFDRILFFIGLLCPVVLFTGVYFNENWGWQAAGLVFGTVTAFLILLVVDTFQILVRGDVGEENLGDTRNLLIPFPNPLYSWAARHSLFPSTYQNKVADTISSLLGMIDYDFGRGYFYKQAGSKKYFFYPGVIFSVFLFIAFLGIYVAGFFFWYNSYAPSPFGNDALVKGDFGVTSISYVLMLSTLLCSLLCGLAFFLDRYRIPTLLVIFLVVMFAPLRHTYVTTEKGKNEILDLKPHEVLALKKDSPYIILVAANGGGIQATAWTAKVLTELMKVCKDLDRRDNGCERSIALISSVSGGSVGTMFFLNGYDESGGISKDVLEKTANVSKASSLDYVAGGLVYADFIRNFPGVYAAGLQDRGGALEKSWRDNIEKEFQDKAIAQGLNADLSKWREDASKGKRPAVIFNSTMVETGERVLLATTDTKKPTSPDDKTPCSSGYPKLFEGWKNFHTMFPTKDIKVTTAARLSASFPVVGPAPNMKDYEKEGAPEFAGMHFVDGGYNENYGITSLLDWLDEALCTDPTFKPKIIIIQIIGDRVFKEDKNVLDTREEALKKDKEVYNTENKNTAAAAPSPILPTKRPDNIDNSWFGQILAPATTILGVRGTAQLTTNEAELEYFLRYWARNPEKCVNAVTGEIDEVCQKAESQKIEMYKLVFEYVPVNKCEGIAKCEGGIEEPPLSWHLTPSQKDDIDNAWKRVFNLHDKSSEAFEKFKTLISSP